MCRISKIFISRIVISLMLLLSLSFCVLPGHGYTMTSTATNQSITIPMQQWQTLTSEFRALSQDLIQCQTDLSRLKKPSTELLNELTEAQKMLKQLQEDFNQQKQDLTMLSKEVEELKTLSARLKEQINKERKVHKRQVWQNRIWCLLIGCGIGIAVK